MQRARAAFIAVGTIALIVACNDGVPPVAGPDVAIGRATSGTWTSTIWQTTDSGLQYVGSRTGLYRSAIDGKAIVDSGMPVQLAANAIAAAAETVEHESVILRFRNGNGFAARHSATTERRPQIHNGRTIQLGSRDGHSYALQQSVNPADPNAPAAASILLADGSPVSVSNSRYRKVSGGWHVSHSMTTVLDSTSNARFVVSTDYGVEAVRSLSALDQVRNGLTVAGDVLASLVQPAALEAQSSGGYIPCQSEMENQLKAAAAWTMAAAALATAAATCPITGLTCAAVPWLTATLVIADVAFGIAIGNYILCMKNRPHPEPGPGGGNGSGGNSCYTIDWYESTDGGHNWVYIDSTYQCEPVYQE